jgi:hypothetical protein
MLVLSNCLSRTFKFITHVFSEIMIFKCLLRFISGSVEGLFVETGGYSNSSNGGHVPLHQGIGCMEYGSETQHYHGVVAGLLSPVGYASEPIVTWM